MYMGCGYTYMYELHPFVCETDPLPIYIQREYRPVLLWTVEYIMEKIIVIRCVISREDLE